METLRRKSVFILLILFVSLIGLARSAVLLDHHDAAFRNLNLAALKKYKYGSTEHDLELLRDAIIPQHMQHFLKIYQENSELNALLDDVLEVVESPDCKGHIREWFIRATNLSTLFSEENQWVLQMVDSWGKFPEGILSGHVNSLGDFWECLKIDVSDLQILSSAPKDTAKEFQGKYCTMHIRDYHSAHRSAGFVSRATASEKLKLETTPHDGNKNLESGATASREGVAGLVSMMPSIAICMPNSCFPTDIQRFFLKVLNITYDSLLLNATLMPFPVVGFCNENKKPDLDSSAITFVVFLCILVGLSLTSAIYDYYLQHSGNESGKKDLKLAVKCFLAFSVYTNTKKFLTTRKSPEDFGCLHGIRTLSTLWVVLAHTYAVAISSPVWNMIELENSHDNNPTIMAIYNGFFSVDTFFVMSGAMAAVGILKLLDKTKGKFNIPMFYLHRYIRLTPLYAFIIGIVATLLKYMGNGPYFDKLMDETEQNCRKNWWVNLLYINNFYRDGEMCNKESWYLANDMQFYILSPLIIYPIWKWEKIGLALLAVYTALSMASPAILVNHHNTLALLAASRPESMKYMAKIYHKPYARIGAFLIGIFLGWLLYKTRGKQLKLHWTVVTGGWLLATAGALYVIFCVYPWFDPEYDIPKAYNLFYAATSRHIWSVCIGWIIFACVKGYGGIVNRFLSWSAFMPLGRLCFSVYLTSVHLQQIYQVRLTKPFVYDTYNMIHLFFAHAVMSYLVAYGCTIVFESPFIILQKLIFEGDGRRKPRPQKDKSATSSPATVVEMKEM